MVCVACLLKLPCPQALWRTFISFCFRCKGLIWLRRRICASLPRVRRSNIFTGLIESFWVGPSKPDTDNPPPSADRPPAAGDCVPFGDGLTPLFLAFQLHTKCSGARKQLFRDSDNAEPRNNVFAFTDAIRYLRLPDPSIASFLQLPQLCGRENCVVRR